jgi:RNA polymerase sigma-70 factor, ECF subfamily
MPTTEIDALDKADMLRLAQGQDDALDTLMTRHAQSVFQFLYRMLGQEEDANDLAQDTFVRVFQARKSFRPNQAFRPWLYTIAANLARNHIRWRSRHPATSWQNETDPQGVALEDKLAAPTPDPTQVTVASEEAAAVQAAVQSLPPDLREAVVLCEWQELTMAEAAEVLQTTAKAVESRLYRARQNLRERLKHWLSDSKG